MKRLSVSAATAVLCVSGLGFLSACGGSVSGSGGGNNQQPPTIASFSANPATIQAGSSASLTAVFSNGTGMVTPGNIAVTSGTSISVTPSATTTYTLTVTGTGGTVTQATTVTVNPAAPTITSFVAGAATLEAGSSTTLTAVFTGGAGVVTPGNITVTSGTAVTVTPATTTTYTLTVTPAAGAAITQTATVTVVPVPTITSFAANPTTISPGASSSLTAVFTGGAGMITPGNITVVSGTPVSVSPSATTTYTLTVTPPVGSVTATQTVTVTVSSGLISSFSANPNFIASGKGSNLIPVFSGGTGVIMPGNIAVISGASVPVSPTATTTYTLTVTPTGGGTAQTATVTVTVYSITSFTASPNPVVAGNSSQLSAVFVNGTGVITAPGGYSTNVTSGTPVSVSPSVTTTYTLTVTPTQGTGSAITQTATVTVTTAVSVDLNTLGPAVTSHLLGTNLAMWYDVITNKTAIVNAFQSAGITAVRWPGGSNSDIYHWNGQATYPTIASPTNCNGGYSVPQDTFSSFLTDIVTPANLDLAVTANYGSNATCNGGGQPSEAAGWAAAAVAYGVPIHYMTVGNESYGSWEYDLHTLKQDPTTYASAVSGANGYYSLIKAQSPNTLVGAVVDADGKSNGWDTIVLGNAKGSYDFVEYHYYPQYSPPAVTSDTYLVHQAALDFTTNINKVKTALAAAGASGTPIYVGELGANSANPGTQSWSITQGLYAGQILGEAMTDGVSRLTWWLGFGNCLGSANVAANGNTAAYNNNNPSLYGWQNTWGAFNIFSDADSRCPGEGPIGTMSPTAQAFNLFQNVAVTGEHALTATVNGDATNVRAYAASHSGGAAIVLFNLNQNAGMTVSLATTGQPSSSDVKVITYDKATYDLTNASTPVWAAPTTTDMGAQNLPLTLTLTPWSMNVVLIK